MDHVVGSTALIVGVVLGKKFYFDRDGSKMRCVSDGMTNAIHYNPVRIAWIVLLPGHGQTFYYRHKFDITKI